MSDQNNQKHPSAPGPAPIQPPDEKKHDMKVVTKILKTPSESRTQKQCAELFDQIGDLQFFKQYNEDPTTANVPKLCCKYMEIEQFPDNEIIFEFGSVGNKFYVVLEGSVGVYIKKPPPAQPEAEDKAKAALAANAVQAIVDPLADFMRVKVLPEGSSFGELALLNNKPRLATIKCLAPTYVATLSKENFNKILKEHEEQKLNKEIDFFQSVPGFCDLNIKQIRFLCLNNKQIETNKNDLVFDEKDPCDSLFVIKQGEFEVFKLVEKQMDQKEEIMKQNILSFSALNKNSNVKVLKQIKIKVLTVGEMIGEESLVKKSQREFRLVCSSHKGTIIKIKANDFLRKINEEPAVSQAFFKRFSANYEENEQRVQKRIQQFHEFKNFLIEDRVPVKLRISIDKLYSNNSLTLEQKKASISEFRQQAIEFENMQKKSDLQTAILSQSAITQRLSQVNPMNFQNQVQFYKYKRLSLLAADPKNTMGTNTFINASSSTTTNIPYASLGSNNAFGSMKDLSKWKQQQQPSSSKAVPPLNLIQSLCEIDAEEDDSPVSSSRQTQKKDDLISPKNHASTNSGRNGNPLLSNLSPNNKSYKLNQQDNIASPEITSQMSPKSKFNVGNSNNNNRSFVKQSYNSPYLFSGNESPSTAGDARSQGLGRIPLDRGAQAARRKLYYQSGNNTSIDNAGQSSKQAGQVPSSQAPSNNNTSILPQSAQTIPGSNSASDNYPTIEQGNNNIPSAAAAGASAEGNNRNVPARMKHQFSVDSTQNLQQILGLENSSQQKQQVSTSQDPSNYPKDKTPQISRASLKFPSNIHRSQSQILPKDAPSFNQQSNQLEYGNSKKYSIYEIHESQQPLQQQQQQPQQYSPELIGGVQLSKNSSKLKSNTEFGEVFDGSAASLLNLRNANKEQFTAFQFNNNDKKRQVKATLLKDNFIRDWKKHQDLPYEDAQQQTLIKKIKKITSQTEKFTDYLRPSAHIQESAPNQNNQHTSNSNQNNITYSHPLQLYSPTLGIVAGIKQQQQQQPDQSPLANNAFNVVSLPKIPEAASSQIQINASTDPSRKQLPLSRNSNQYPQQSLNSSPLIMSVSGAGAMKQSFHPRVHHRQLKKQILVFNQ